MEMQTDEGAAEHELNPDHLRIYYKRIFPFQELCKWLSYGNDGKHPACDSSFFRKREFSCTLKNDIFLRYMSFRDAEDMQSLISKKCPLKMDIGAVYNLDPAQRAAYSKDVFQATERELVFDIDMTDYDDIRNCCSGADICLKCWPLMTIAIKVLDKALRVDFGFEHILWVYSGRRGVHCWVCDTRARKLTNEQRASVANYFRVYKGNENNRTKVRLTGSALHPSLSRAYSEVLEPYFEEILEGQSLLYPQENYEKVLKYIPDYIADQMRQQWSVEHTRATDGINIKRWQKLRKELLKKNRRTVQEIIFSVTYPRLDLEVSKHLNHLLKSPFCVHPKTGRICVPIDPQDADNFDPTTVPTLSQLLDDLNKTESDSGLRGKY